MSDKNDELKIYLESICDKYYNKWSIDKVSNINDLSVVEIQSIAILMTRVDQQSDPRNVSCPISDAPNSDVVFELLGRLMDGDTKDHDELISDLRSTLKSNAVAYYMNNAAIAERIQKSYVNYCEIIKENNHD